MGIEFKVGDKIIVRKDSHWSEQRWQYGYGSPLAIQTITSINVGGFNTSGYNYRKSDIEHYIEFKIGDEVIVREDSHYRCQRHNSNGDLLINTITDIRYSDELPIKTDRNSYRSYDLELYSKSTWVPYASEKVDFGKVTVEDLEEFKVKRI